MTNHPQFDFDNYPAVAGHRSDETSADAAADITPELSRLRRIALDAIGRRGPLGFTSEELADAVGVPRVSIQPRTSELYRLGKIAKSQQKRRNASSNKMARVWVLPAYAAQEREAAS
jgi:hypothetical protein